MTKFKHLFVVLVAAAFIAGCSTANQTIEKKEVEIKKVETGLFFNPDTVQSSLLDLGTMWTFEYAPVDYFEKTYNFKPSKEWLEDVRMSALKFATYCSASFVSEDGLVMTNNHCSRDNITKVTREGEDLQENGFFAERLEDERQVPGLFIDQLIYTEDVSKEIQDKVDQAKTEEEKSEILEGAIQEIQERVKKEKGFDVVQITPLFYGGKYSLYGYKRYNDVRLVFTPETQMGFYGGDPDNFTYPRYDLDVTFYRVYDDAGKPLKVKNFFQWSTNGAKEGEVVFVIGNPGNTDRLLTVSQLEFMRDVDNPRIINAIDDLMKIYEVSIEAEKDAKKKEELENTYFSYSNSHKAISGQLSGLRDPFLMAKKKDFEKKFRAAVNEKSSLKEKYGNLWDQISEGREQYRKVSDELFVYNLRNAFMSSRYFVVASNLNDIAKQLKQPEAARNENFKGEALTKRINGLYPEDFNPQLEKMKLVSQLKRMERYLGKDNEFYKALNVGSDFEKAAEKLINNSVLSNPEKVKSELANNPDAIMTSNDPFIKFVRDTEPRRMEITQVAMSVFGAEEIYQQSLGRALFEVYGTKIPPDATFTLRISDGVVKGYDYNGTTAPAYTTFYGMYDRFYSFDKKSPYHLPQRWVTPPAEFNLETPFNFVSTNDIIGGNSGSAIINKNAEVVGLIFDGNIESLPGSFIFVPESNRSVSVHSAGLLEAVQDMYKAKRLSEELKAGKIK